MPFKQIVCALTVNINRYAPFLKNFCQNNRPDCRKFFTFNSYSPPSLVIGMNIYTNSNKRLLRSVGKLDEKIDDEISTWNAIKI